MTLDDLLLQVRSHQGVFLCEGINYPEQRKEVHFTHRVSTLLSETELPDIGRLRDFYATFGSITFFVDALSGDEGKHLASPENWAELDAEFRGWIDHFSEEEKEDYLPDWVDTCLVIGEEPRTGNYLLMPTQGESEGRVFVFDHDGYEFVEEAKDIVAYVEYMLKPDNALLVSLASHMRFIEEGSQHQWWILELRDNRGNFATTAA